MRQHIWRLIVGRSDRPAYEFYDRMLAAGYEPSAAIDVLPEQKIIYVSVPKSASSRIKVYLSSFLGRQVDTSEAAHNRKQSGLKAPHHVGLSKFYRLAMNADTLRFSFVRNPYARLVSCWADKFRDKPLIVGDPFVDSYLNWRWRSQIDPRPPTGIDQTLSFADFARFAAATAWSGIDAHWQVQQQIVDVPGLRLDFIGKVETFDQDFACVYDHVGIEESLRRMIHRPIRSTSHDPWYDYYTPDLARLVYRAYERDFDRFRYPRTVPV